MIFCFQENFNKHGLAALNLVMDYDENEIMNNNLKYLTNTLEVSYLTNTLEVNYLQCT